MSRFEVGAEATLIVGVTGIVTAVGDGTVTIGNVILPLHIGPHEGLFTRYVSDEIPGAEEFDPEPCEDCEHAEARADRDVSEFGEAIRADHELHHEGPIRFCTHLTCRHLEERTS